MNLFNIKNKVAVITGGTGVLGGNAAESLAQVGVKVAIIGRDQNNVDEKAASITKKGGNAIDASVAVQFALAVVYPNAGNIGGGGFLVYRDAKGKTDALDYREKAPFKAVDRISYQINQGECY